MRMVFLGPPGAGKGTQAVRLGRERGLPHISTGNILRSAAASGTPLGEQVRGHMEAGDLVPDDVMNAVVEERLKGPDCAGGFILDGFPRTKPQAEALDGMLANRGVTLDVVLYVDVPREELIRRLSGRRLCQDCGANLQVADLAAGAAELCPTCGAQLIQRKDDLPRTVANRLEVYEKTTAPLVTYYEHRGSLRRVDGLGTPDDVYRNIVAALSPSAGRAGSAGHGEAEVGE